MKVKEIPTSISTQIRLSSTTKENFIKQKERIPAVVSVASIPSRLNIVHLTIRSILNQDVLPKKIILWLHKDLETKIPKKLAYLEGDIFSIKFSNTYSSHRKLVETLRLYPNEVIVTFDDDMMYRKNWLSKLYEVHKNQPKKIIANQTRCITRDENGELLSYKQWTPGQTICENPDTVLPIGAGGTLYPSNSLDSQVFDEKLYMQLAPKADDLWFKAMALLKGTKSIQANNGGKEPIPIWGSQKVSLKKSNISEDKNRSQWLALANHFKLKV
ncbi:glycosyltransferase family A protein [Flagellimonas sp. S3867]|uniref:glycosyltransferase family A protein n=1 Tax=Flagellimonas sp. S3867 TaxID=2768063 RepID=UPI001684FBAA|nr:glycosyltransferase family A protein [Flagellimonas sp. S3867]